MIKRGSFVQETSSTIWDVKIPEGATKARPLAAYTLSGNSYEIDSWSFEGGHLLVNFGIDPIVGELEYEYQVEGSDQVVVDANGNQVSITINQYGGGPSTSTFQQGS